MFDVISPGKQVSRSMQQRGILARVSKNFVRSLLKKVSKGHLTITHPDGRVESFGKGSSGVHAAMKLHSDAVFWRVVRDGGIGLGESYVDGEWDTDDLSGVLHILLDNFHALDEGKINILKPVRFLHQIGHLLKRNSVSNSRKNIKAHYDLNNDFFSLFLDESMTYSSGIYKSAQDDLATAQKNKINSIIQKARIGASDHVLEIGSGWGGLAIEAVRQTGCRVTSITVSDEQLKLARKRVEAAGLSHKINIELCDYRVVQGKFDKLVSVEMMEAVGREYLPSFFETCERVLHPDGLAVLQIITFPDQYYADYLKRCDWIQKYIFPGSHLPAVSALLDAITKHSQFIVEGIENIGPHYAPTLAEWRRRFVEKRAAVEALGFDTRFQRMWEYYLASCEAEFATRWLNVIQLVLTRPNNARLIADDQRFLNVSKVPLSVAA